MKGLIADKFQVAEPRRRRLGRSSGRRAPRTASRSRSPTSSPRRRANGGKAPPDLSLIIKAREDGPNYIHALLTGYVPFEKLTPAQIKEFARHQGRQLQHVLPGPQDRHAAAARRRQGDLRRRHQGDARAGSLPTSSSSCAWASEPHLEDRNRTGVRVILFLLAMAGLMYAVKRLGLGRQALDRGQTARKKASAGAARPSVGGPASALATECAARPTRSRPSDGGYGHRRGRRRRRENDRRRGEFPRATLLGRSPNGRTTVCAILT